MRDQGTGQFGARTPTRVRWIVLVGLVGLLIALGPSGQADTLRLKNGNLVVGRIVEETEDSLRIDTGSATLTFSRTAIETVEKGQVAEFVLQQGEVALRTSAELMKKGDTTQARQILESALLDVEDALGQGGPSPEPLLDLQLRLDRARIETLPKDPRSQKAEQLYAQALDYLDHLDYTKALGVLEEAAQTAPERADVHLRLADAAQHVDERSKAIRAYQRVLELDSRTYYREASGPLLTLLRQQVQKYLAERRADEAVGFYEEVVLLAGKNPEKPVGLDDYLARRTERKTKPRDALLMEVYKHADANDLVDLAFAAIKQVQSLKPEDKEIGKLVAEQQFLSEFKSKVEAGKADEAGQLTARTPPEVTKSERVAEKMGRIAGELAPKIEAETLLARAKAAFEAMRFAEAAELARTLALKFPDAKAAGEAAELLKKSEFEGKIQQGLGEVEALIEQGKDDQAEERLKEVQAIEGVDGSLQAAKVQALAARIPQERTAEEGWTLASAELDRKEYEAALKRLTQLAEEYPNTRAGRKAVDWLKEHRRRLQREAARYKPTDRDFISTLTDPGAWRAASDAGTGAAQRITPVANRFRTAAWRAYDSIMALDLAGKIERRSRWLHLVLPLGAGTILLLGLLWVFARPGVGTYREPEATTMDTDTPEADAAPKRATTDPPRGPSCRMCGQLMPNDVELCPACGAAARLTEVEAARAADENRWANYDPWEFRTRQPNINEFEAHFERAKQLAAERRLDGAIQACRRALHEDPHRSDGYALLADLYELKGMPQEAGECYREILLLDPTTVVVRRKMAALFALAEQPLNPGLLPVALSGALWWSLFWVIQGVNPQAWVPRIALCLAGGALTAWLWSRVQHMRKRTVPAPVHHGAETPVPLSAGELSWREQNRQARFLAQLISEHTGIEVPALTVGRFLVALALAGVLLAALVAIAWFRHTPYALLAWPGGVTLLIYLFELHPRVATAHAVLRHLYEETLSPWVDPHRPFKPKVGTEGVVGEFLIRKPSEMPLRWAVNPAPYPNSRQGLLNSLQQMLNRHWEFHRFYSNLRVVRAVDVPTPAGFGIAKGAALAVVAVAMAGTVGLGIAKLGEGRGYRESMSLGYQYLLQGDLSHARDYFFAAIHLDRERVSPYLYLAHAEAGAGRDFAAERAFREAARRAPAIAAAHNDYANFLQKKGRFREAIPEYERALKAEPNNADILNNLGSNYFKMQDYTRAVDFLLPAIKANPDHSRAPTTLGLAYEAIGDRERARKAYEKAVRAAPEEPYTQVARNRLDAELQPEDESPLRLEGVASRAGDKPTSGGTASVTAGTSASKDQK